MASKVKVAEVQDEGEEVDTDRIGTLNSVLSEPEVVVGEPEETVVPQQNGPTMYVVRINEDIEEMSYVADGRRESYTFEAGHQYRVPWYIAQELERNGKIWH